MCFSATASFVVAGGLSLIGLLSVRSVQTKEQYPLAITPFLFAIQQASEGIVWFTMYNHAQQALNGFATMLFLIFAMTFWPIWIPNALFILEKRTARRKLLFGLYLCGAAIASYSYYRLFFFPVHVEVLQGNLLYFIEYKRVLSPGISLLLYFVPTVASFFVSSVSLMWLFGFIATGTLLFSYLVWYTTLISVWCFFAAVLSVLILFSLRVQKISRL